MRDSTRQDWSWIKQNLWFFIISAGLIFVAIFFVVKFIIVTKELFF